MKINVAQVIGLNTDQKAAQVISSSRNGDHSFLAVLILSSDDAFTKGRQVLSELSDFYFDLEGDKAGEKLTATFEEAKKKFAEGEFAILLAAVSGKILYLISKGEVEVYLKRSEKLSPLLVVGAQSQLISGFLQERDRLLFATSSLITFLGEELTKSLELPLDAFEQDLSDRVGVSNVENQLLAALLVDVETEGALTNISNLEQPEPNLELPPDFSDTPTNINKSLKKILSEFLTFLRKQTKYFPKSNRGRLILAVILIVVIAFGVGFKVKSNKEIKAQADFNKSLQQAKDDFNSAKGLVTLNPAEAKLKLDKAKENLNLALSLKPKDSEAQNLKKQIETDEGSILQQFKVNEFPQVYDMDLVKKNFRATQLSFSNGKLLLLDQAAKTLVAVDLSKKSNQILAGSEQLGDATYASLNGGLAFVYSKDKGVSRVDLTNQKISSVSKKDSDFGEIKDIYGFAGNVYLLDLGNPPAGGQIWKYLATSDGYSDKREYLNKSTKVDLTNTLRLQIESSIFVLKSGGEILRFTRGDKDNFSFEGLPSGVKDPKSFFVSSETDNLYLLDSGNSRLLILTKTGAYKGQITGDKFTQITDLAVDEKGKKVYLLDGSKIYQVDLK